MKEKIMLYYRLAKPGIIYGNIFTAAAGFLFASQGNTDGWKLVVFLLGMSGVIGAACVLNNIIDRGIDEKMARTKKRALVTGDISLAGAVVYAIILAIVGFWLLAFFTNWLTVFLGAFALLFYVVIYGVAKRKTIFGTLVGAIPGAVPPVAGYVAVANQFDSIALLLFVVLMMWQMPHFYAIALYRRKEYEAAGIPVWSVKRGSDSTKNQMFLFIVGFIVTSLLLTILGYTGVVYAVVMLVMGFLWLYKMRRGVRVKNEDKWARGMFVFSLKVLLVFCFLLAVDAWLA